MFPFSFWKTSEIDPLTINGILCMYCPELAGDALGAATIVNMVDGFAHGTLQSGGVIDNDGTYKQFNVGATGRVSFGNRYKPTTGVTIMNIMYNISVADVIQFTGGAGDTGDEGFLLFKNSAHQWGFRANIGNSVNNQITATIFNGDILNKWNLFTGTYNGTTSKIYFNNTLKTNGGNPYTGNISYNGITTHYWATVQGQTAQTARFWNGYGRAYLIFSRALEEWEITGIYNYFKNRNLV